MKSRIRGFTAVEIGIMVIVIAVLAMIAIPNMIRAAESDRASICRFHLRLIRQAKQDWAYDNHQRASAEPTRKDLTGYISTKDGWVVCPDGGKYTIGAVGHDPTCSFGDAHSLTASKPKR